MSYQHQVGDDGYIFDYAVDQEANAAWYPDNVGYRYFETTIPTFLQAAQAARAPVWMGLIVSPNAFAAQATNWSFLQAEAPKFEAVADDLYAQYGSQITGWDIPTEPGESVVSTYNNSYQYGAWLQQIDNYLHSHDGDKPVMITPEMPSAVLSGLTPYQFAQQMQPMMQIARIDIWNFEDGFGMTGWTPQQEAQGFQLAAQYASKQGAAVWADVYTPPNLTPAQFEPYLTALNAKIGVAALTEWLGPEYLDPAFTADNASSSSDFSSYRSWCSPS